MYRLVIQFPFSSMNDERYMLVLSASRNGAFTAATDAMDTDTRCFKHISTTTVDGDIIKTYEGTLAGQVISSDDDREDVFKRLVSSKLRFNMACQQFPAWLMDLCNYYTNVAVVLYAFQGATKYERWRGYLMANTLNMTVVNDLMACPMVAVDEVGIAKYLKFTDNFPSGEPYLSILELIQKYRQLHQANFSWIYTALGLTALDTLVVERDLLITDDNGNNVTDILGTLVVNLERYYLDRDATWESVIGDLCEYLGVNYCVGGIGSAGNDMYILSDADYGNTMTVTYNLTTSAMSTSNTRFFADFGNQAKVGADLQLTYKPDEWKGVKVKSKPERPPVHDYLGKDNVKPVEPSAGHGQWCETRIGQKKDSTKIDDYKYRVFQYTKIVDKEDQWISEAEYIEMEDCHVATAARTVGIADGYFPLTDSALGHLRPTGTDTDSLDFALSKWGMITARLGTYETLRQKVSADLKDYIVILNNFWGRKYWDGDAAVSDSTSSPVMIGKLSPFASDASVRPSNQSFLTIDFSAIFLNENIGDDIRSTDQSVTPNTEIDDFEGLIQAVFPMTESIYNWEAGEAARYTGSLTLPDSVHKVYSYYPYIYARLHIGNYFWNGSDWAYYADLADGPWFQLPLIPTGATSKYWMIATGYIHGDVNNYYYTECRPKVGASDNVFRVPLDGLSVHNQPLDGKVELEIGGRIPPFNGFNDLGVEKKNNIIFCLIYDVEIKFTDESEISGVDIDTIGSNVVDAASKTKKTNEVSLALSTPTVDGVFSNCLLFDGGAKWHNLVAVKKNGGTAMTAEQRLADDMAPVLCGKQIFVEFSRRFAAIASDNIYNVGFTVSNLTETSGTFMPLQRTFDWTKGVVRWKMQKVG